MDKRAKRLYTQAFFDAHHDPSIDRKSLLCAFKEDGKSAPREHPFSLSFPLQK